MTKNLDVAACGHVLPECNLVAVLLQFPFKSHLGATKVHGSEIRKQPKEMLATCTKKTMHHFVPGIL